MKKILMIRRLRKGTFDGTDNYCQGLHQLFEQDEDCRVLTVPDIPQVPSRLYHFSYAPDVLRPYIEQADIIHINGYTDQGTIDALRMAHEMGKRVIYTAHWHPFRCLGHPLLGKMFFDLKLKKVIQECADVVTTINAEDTDFFSSFHKHVIRIPHWMLRTPKITGAERIANRILFVGRINDQVKNFQQLLAIPEGKYEITCVGKGDLPTQRKDIKQYTNISDEELLTLYSQASLVVIPSKYEAFSFVAQEALMMGTPVLMSDHVRIADYLNGIKGYNIYKFGDSVDFVNKIESTIGQSVDVDKVINTFDPEVIKDLYKSIYLS